MTQGPKKIGFFDRIWSAMRASPCKCHVGFEIGCFCTIVAMAFSFLAAASVGPIPGFFIGVVACVMGYMKIGSYIQEIDREFFSEFVSFFLYTYCSVSGQDSEGRPIFTIRPDLFKKGSHGEAILAEQQREAAQSR